MSDARRAAVMRSAKGGIAPEQHKVSGLARTSRAWIAAFLFATSSYAGLIQPAAAQNTAKTAPARDEAWRSLLTPEELQTLASRIDIHTKRIQGDMTLPGGPDPRHMLSLNTFNENRISQLSKNIVTRTGQVRSMPGNTGLRKDLVEQIAEREARLAVAPALKQKADAAQTTLNNTPAPDEWRSRLTPEETRAMPGRIGVFTAALQNDFKSAQRDGPKTVSDFKMLNKIRISVMTAAIARTREMAGYPQNKLLRENWLKNIAEREARTEIERTLLR